MRPQIVHPPDVPLVSALVTAYDLERFVGEAIESALAQERDGFDLEVVVVEDGSRDGTAEVVERYVRAHPDSVRMIRRPNGGYVSACNEAIAEARGDLLAFLDGDDAWPADKTRTQVALLRERPEVGLVYGDMRVIDAEGTCLQESWLEGDNPPSGRCYARLLTGNPATSSSIMLRASLARRIGPIPGDVPYADWWLALRVAQLSELAYLAEPRTLYRFHGANLSLGVQGEPRVGLMRRTIDLQRRMLRSTTLAAATPRELGAAWAALERFAVEAHKASTSPFVMPATVTDDDRHEALALVAEGEAAAAQGEVDAALVRFLHAAAADPWCAPAREGFQRALVAATLGRRRVQALAA